jgi:DNA (cytosine-5)-methyltransferase 1
MNNESINLVLSLFPGIGLLDMAFEEEGFCVVRGPDLLWGGNVKKFHPPARRFDGIIGGPPCQFASRMRHMVIQNGYELAENLIPEYERCVDEGRPNWFVMENVPDAPAPVVKGYAVATFRLNNRWLGEAQNRLRVFSFGVQGSKAVNLRDYIQLAALESIDFAPAVCASGGHRHRPVKIGGNGKVKRGCQAGDLASKRSVAEALRLQGLPDDFFKHSPFKVEGQQRVLGNGVPLPMGKAIAKAVKQAIASLGSERAA